MLPRAHRLVESDSFRHTVRSGQRAGGRTLVVHLAGGPEDTTAADPPRVGFVVSKAVGNAVVRNRVKRRLRHVARELVSTLPGSAVLVVRALPAAADATYDELGVELERGLARCRERAAARTAS